MTQSKIAKGPSATTKTTHIQVRLSDEDKALIQRYAKEAGQSLSDYVRGAAMARVWHETTAPPDPIRPASEDAKMANTKAFLVPKKRSYEPDPR